jgi:hypothetical protein
VRHAGVVLKEGRMMKGIKRITAMGLDSNIGMEAEV